MRPDADTRLIWTGAPCSYGCGACPIDQATAPAGLDIAELLRHLSSAPTDQRSLALLLGGEPFLRPDLLRLLAVVRAGGWVPGIVSTGRPLVYPQLRQRLRRAGLAYLRIQFFGVGDAHDRATAVPGAFEQAVSGVRAWIAEGMAECDVDIALTIRHRAAENLALEIERLADEIASPAVQLVVVIDPVAGGEAGAQACVQRAMTALAHWNDDPSRPLLAWEGLPEPPSPASSLTIAPLPAQFVAVTPAASCLGRQEERNAVRSADLQHAHANSFNFVRTATVVPWTADPAACTAYRAADAEAASRHLWLVEDDRLVLYATDTGDFTPGEIARVKDEWSHVFIDRAAAGVLDDFTEGMRRVLPEATCDSCSHRTRCGRRFHAIDGPPFADEEAWIAHYVANLRGRVLDVGCGEQLYRDALAPLLRTGSVQYTGLDPDELSLSRIREALPQGRFYLTGIEDFRGPAASYDHILCLRSLNHVVDVDEACARMARLLKPGGQVLLVECTPFALLRQPQQVVAADGAPRAGHQHFRNLASTDVLPFARRRGLRALHHHRAALDTTNEWILLLGRDPAASNDRGVPAE